MRRLLAAVAAAAALLALTGCESMLEREFTVSSSHAEATTTTQNAEVVRVNTVSEAMELLAQAVRAGNQELTVQLAYRGTDLDAELREAIAEYQNDPVCAYAVQLLPYRINPSLTYQEIRFDISYRRTAEQIAAIRTLRSPSRFEEELLSLLRDFAETRAYLLENYDPEVYDPDRIIRSLYESTPSVAYGMTDVSYTLVPESGPRRIMEVTVSYAEDASVLAEKARSAADRAQVLAASSRTVGDALFRGFHDTLARLAVYDGTAETAAGGVYTDSCTAYGALVQNRAGSTGYAMAYKELCDAAGLECRVVHGRLGSADRSWNMICLSDGEWYHVDVSLDDTEEGVGYRFFGLNDAQMALTHQWDAQKYPVSEGEHGRSVLPDDILLRSLSRLPGIDPLPGEEPTEPTAATEPTEPTAPTDPTQGRVEPTPGRTEPTLPVQRPTEPTVPDEPDDPTASTDPSKGSDAPTEPTDAPDEPDEPTEATEPTDPTTAVPDITLPTIEVTEATLPTLPELTMPEVTQPDPTVPDEPDPTLPTVPTQGVGGEPG